MLISIYNLFLSANLQLPRLLLRGRVARAPRFPSCSTSDNFVHVIHRLLIIPVKQVGPVLLKPPFSLVVYMHDMRRACILMFVLPTRAPFIKRDRAQGPVVPALALWENSFSLIKSYTHRVVCRLLVRFFSPTKPVAVFSIHTILAFPFPSIHYTRLSCAS